ncbi:MAG: protease pro-enzyme activation domain-containing protein, partial [Thermoplasmata archaeon]
MIVLLTFALVPLAGTTYTAAHSTGASSGRPVGLTTDERALPAGEVTHALPRTTNLQLVATVAPRNAADLAARDASVINPRSVNYRHFLTEPEFEAAFEPTSTTVREVESYFSNFGAHGFVSTAEHLGIEFRISASGAEAALGITFLQYGGSVSRPLYTAVGEPLLSPSLRGVVTGISGLSDYGAAGLTVPLATGHVARPVREAEPSSFVLGPGGSPQWFVGSDFTQAYNASELFPPSTRVANATFPTHEAVATILMSSYNATNNVDLPPFDPAVVAQYFNDTFPSSWPHPVVGGVPVTIDGVTPPPPGSLGLYNDST